jgi:tRNA threonylcarbamoyladenosine biosynthesis protein TsaB
VGIGQGMAFAADLPCLPIVCLDAVALEGIRQLNLKENDQVIAATDARMSEVYWARYVVQANGLPERQDDVYLSAPKDIDIPSTPFALVGNAVTAYPEDMLAIKQQAMAIDEAAVPHARSIAQLGLDALEKGLQVSAAELQPIYVRDKVAQTIAERALEKSHQEKS